MEWYSHGLETPASVIDASAEYRKNEDVMGTFLADCCEVYAAQQVEAAVLYGAYTMWCQQRAQGEAAAGFGRRLKDRQFEPKRTESARYWVGLRVLDGAPTDLF